MDTDDAQHLSLILGSGSLQSLSAKELWQSNIHSVKS